MRNLFDLQVCYYCEVMPATVKDHIVPVSRVGRVNADLFATVPSCVRCNCILGNRFFPTMKERKEYVLSYYFRHRAKVLRYLVAYIQNSKKL